MQDYRPRVQELIVYGEGKVTRTKELFKRFDNLRDTGKYYIGI